MTRPCRCTTSFVLGDRSKGAGGGQSVRATLSEHSSSKRRERRTFTQRADCRKKDGFISMGRSLSLSQGLSSDEKGRASVCHLRTIAPDLLGRRERTGSGRSQLDSFGAVLLGGETCLPDPAEVAWSRGEQGQRGGQGQPCRPRTSSCPSLLGPPYAHARSRLRFSTPTGTFGGVVDGPACCSGRCIAGRQAKSPRSDVSSSWIS